MLIQGRLERTETNVIEFFDGMWLESTETNLIHFKWGSKWKVTSFKNIDFSFKSAEI